MSRFRRVSLHASVSAALGLVVAAHAPAQFNELSIFEPSLKIIPVPTPTTINDYIADRDAAIRLGKALFWDVRLGSDGATACATCHHQAGADPRTDNTMHPGANGAFAAGVTPGQPVPATTATGLLPWVASASSMAWAVTSASMARRSSPALSVR